MSSGESSRGVFNRSKKTREAKRNERKMAIRGNGKTLYQIRGRADTQLRLTLAVDPANAKLRVDWRWWQPSRVPGRTHDTTAKGAAIPAGSIDAPDATHLRRVGRELLAVAKAIDEGRVWEYLDGSDLEQPQLFEVPWAAMGGRGR